MLPMSSFSLLVCFCCMTGICLGRVAFGPPSVPACQGSTKGCVQTALWWQTGDTSPTSTWSALQTYLNTEYASGGTFEICKSITFYNYVTTEWSSSGTPNDVLAQLAGALLNVHSQNTTGNACISGSAQSALNNLVQDLICASGYKTSGCGTALTNVGCGSSGTSWSTYATALDNSVYGAGFGNALSYYNAGSDSGCNYGPCSCPTYGQSTCCTVVH